MHHTIWINSALPDAADIFGRNLRYLLKQVNPQRNPLAFACIGSANPNVPVDNLGPLIGTILSRHQIPNVYGTMEAPLNALTLPYYMPLLKATEKNCCLIAIDAAIGTPVQTGYLTLTKGSIRPGSALRRKLPPVGHLHITSVFEQLNCPVCRQLLPVFCRQLTSVLINSSFSSLPPQRFSPPYSDVFGTEDHIHFLQDAENFNKVVLDFLAK